MWNVKIPFLTIQYFSRVKTQMNQHSEFIFVSTSMWQMHKNNSIKSKYITQFDPVVWEQENSISHQKMHSKFRNLYGAMYILLHNFSQRKNEHNNERKSNLQELYKWRHICQSKKENDYTLTKDNLLLFYCETTWFVLLLQIHDFSPYYSSNMTNFQKCTDTAMQNLILADCEDATFPRKLFDKNVRDMNAITMGQKNTFIDQLG